MESIKRIGFVIAAVTFGFFIASSNQMAPTAVAKATAVVAVGEKYTLWMDGGETFVKVTKVVDDCWIEAESRNNYTFFNLCAVTAIRHDK